MILMPETNHLSTSISTAGYFFSKVKLPFLPFQAENRQLTMHA